MLRTWLSVLIVLAFSASGVRASEIEIELIKKDAKEQKGKTPEIRLMADGSLQIQGQIQAVDAEKGMLKLKAAHQEERVRAVAQLDSLQPQLHKAVEARRHQRALEKGKRLDKQYHAIEAKLKLAQFTLELQKEKRNNLKGWVPPMERVEQQLELYPALVRMQLEVDQLMEAHRKVAEEFVGEAGSVVRAKRQVEDAKKRLADARETVRPKVILSMRLAAIAEADNAINVLQDQIRLLEKEKEVLKSQREQTNPPRIIALTRATYPMPKEKAEKLTTLLKDVKAQVLEVKIEADALVVTTTPEVQKAIAPFIALLMGQPQGMTQPGTSKDH